MNAETDEQLSDRPPTQTGFSTGQESKGNCREGKADRACADLSVLFPNAFAAPSIACLGGMSVSRGEAIADL